MSRSLIAIAAVVIALSIASSFPPAHIAAARRCAAPSSFGSTRTSGGGGLMAGLNVDQLTDQSDLVALGRVESFRACAGGPGGAIVTEVMLTVERSLKGSRTPGTRIAVDVPGGHLDGSTLLVGSSAQFVAGERAVVFLRRVSGGKLRVTADFQGKLDVGVGGLVEPLDLSVSQLEPLIAKAASGALAATEDPRASAAGEVVEPAFVAFAYWDTADMPVQYWLNLNDGLPAQLTAPQTQQAWTAAFSTWENDPWSTITFQLAGRTTRTSEVDCDPHDGNNDITWGLFDPEHDPNVLAITLNCVNMSGRILDAEIEFDTDHFGPQWRVDGSGACGSGVFDLETVALHESGHFLGLGHPPSNGCAGTTGICPVMNSSYTGVLRSLCLDDINGVSALYPAGVGGLAAAPEVVEPPTGGSRSLVFSALMIAAGSALVLGAAYRSRRDARP